MAKKRIFLTIDDDIYWELKMKDELNVSKETNDYWRHRIDGMHNPENHKANVIREEIDRLTASVLQATKQKAILQMEMQKIEAEQEKDRQEQIEKEEEVKKKEAHCLQCGNLLQPNTKSKSFRKGNVCHACFLGANLQKIQEWSR